MYSREKQFKQENPKPKQSHRNTPSFSSSLLDEICRSIDEKPEQKTAENAALSKVEKWMENEKAVFRRRPRCDNTVFPDNDPLIFSSMSTSSASSANADLRANRPKPVRTTRRDNRRETDCYLFEEYEEHERHRAAEGDDLIKSKSRAMRIYANLKKMKQPVSPGARLTSFFSSIFAGLNRKKSRGAERNDRAAESPAKMLSRFSTKSSGDEIERNLQLDLARVVVDRDAVPRGQRSLGNGRPPLPPNAFRNRKKCDLDKPGYDSDGDAISESSSDLFELDHSSLFGIMDRFCQELPVYQTTYFDKNPRLFR